ncbi:MAG: carboxypeptidase-like regulatory domain-containing protein [Bacteroidota bacterium]|nr:carboxypeptidase-like regulatory domain-containing protein [Bacteroidota bacterium]
MQTKGVIKTILIFLIISFTFIPLYGQKIKVEFENEPLNNALTWVRDIYGIELSFDDRGLSKYMVSIDTTFNSFEELFSSLLKDTGFDFEKTGDTYLIYPVQKEQEEETKRKYILTGRVVDKNTSEALPYSHVSINGKWLFTDFKGNFSYSSLSDSTFDMKISYLGYYILDTTLTWGRNKIIKLEPSNIEIAEIVVKQYQVEKSIQTGASPGVLRLNHQISSYLPGNGDNSVFNLLRLQPGILAAGEQSNDMIIWGSYEGHSQVRFDGFTIFGLRNYNDNISSVNPYIAKDIKVMKGGFGPEYGERVGGIVDITGIDGNKNDPDLRLSINNMTVNGVASVPLFRKASVVVGFRHTYYDLYNSTNLSIFSTRSRNPRSGSNVDVNVYPDYLFRDLNFKVSGTGDNGDNYFISLYTGADNFSYSVEEDQLNQYLFNEVDESNLQQGTSLFYGKKWKGGGISNISLTYSYLNNQSSEIRQLIRGQNDRIIYNMNRNIDSDITEFTGSVDNILRQSKNHKIEFGTGIIKDHIRHREDTFSIEYIDMDKHILIPNAYFNSIITLRKGLTFKTGLRFDYPAGLEKLYLQPRISASLRINDRMKINSAWGIYNQFITRSSVIDENGNYNYLWVVCDNKDIPVLSGQHYVSGISWSNNNWLASLEAYYKKTDGITRYVETLTERTIYEGDSRSKGIDLFLKKDYNGHSAWVSYSLSKTEEYFPYFTDDEYRRALHDQRHEVKIAGILNLKPAYISANYVYGSGFPYPGTIDAVQSDDYDYNRLDMALVFKFSRNKYNLDAGLSLLNVFNTENIKYSNFVRIPTDETETIDLHAEAVPRTLTLFLNLSF